jgi:hypothetical protein
MGRLIHAWVLARDEQGQQFVWECRCGHIVYQRYGTPVPDELLTHPRDAGQERGEP